MNKVIVLILAICSIVSAASGGKKVERLIKKGNKILSQSEKLLAQQIRSGISSSVLKSKPKEVAPAIEEPERIYPMHLEVKEFPYFSPILNVSTDFIKSTDHCYIDAPKKGYYIPVHIPPKRMLRVSTCNEDTNTKTSISMLFENTCLKIIHRKCRRWPGSIIEYIPQSKQGINVNVRVGAINSKTMQLNNKSKVRITIYTLPVNENNKAKLKKGTVMSSNKASTLRTKVTPKTYIKKSESEKFREGSSNSKLQIKLDKFELNINKFNTNYKMLIAFGIALTFILSAFLIFGYYRKSHSNEYSPF